MSGLSELMRVTAAVAGQPTTSGHALFTVLIFSSSTAKINLQTVLIVAMLIQYPYGEGNKR
jgi:hypothetical protein